jgi:hypothetical protein
MQETTTATLYIAEHKLNDMMKVFDMCASHKVFFSSKQRVSFKTTTLVNEKYWLDMIEKSKAQKDYWIPAIVHEGVMYVSPEIMELSDGKQSAYVGKAARAA